LKGTPAELREFLANVNLHEVDFEVKLGDFGFAKQDETYRLKTQCGTPLYMAPQILNKQLYNYKADIWALGVIFYELIVGTHPFTAKTLKDLRENIKEGVYEFPSDCVPS